MPKAESIAASMKCLTDVSDSPSGSAERHEFRVTRVSGVSNVIDRRPACGDIATDMFESIKANKVVGCPAAKADLLGHGKRQLLRRRSLSVT